MASVKFELRKEVFMRELDKRGWSIEEFSSHARISFVTVYRVLNGNRNPSNSFIAGTMAAFDTSDITDFFLINLSPSGEKEKTEERVR